MMTSHTSIMNTFEKYGWMCEINQLVFLKELYLYSNKLIDLPQSIYNLPKLLLFYDEFHI